MATTGGHTEGRILTTGTQTCQRRGIGVCLFGQPVGGVISVKRTRRP